ncbi:hypothetical protein DFJ74DRAFT_701789 [Hyaloraphidium curvatum]|nr:hypothetical protein DFJ74DRAFT_701789 [Hyaloraphidium curvatum]
MNSGTCDVNPALVEKLKAFRLNQSKATRAFVVKIDKLQIIEDKVLDPTTWEDLQDELPDTQPRYVVVSFERTSTDGRVSYPLVVDVQELEKINYDYVVSRLA